MARRAANPAPVEDIEDDDSLELVDDEPEAKPAKRTVKRAPGSGTPRASNEFGASWLATHVNDTMGTDYTPANIRVILRKMAADGDLEREVGTDRARYQFNGENDPIVRALLKRVKSGEASAAKTEGIKAARGGAKAKVAEIGDEAPPAPRKRTTKAAAAAATDETPTPRATRRRRTA
jgi:hypothetical protein